MTSRLYCVLLLVGCIRIATAGEEVVSFDKWLDKYGYASESVDYGTWKANMEYVLGHNQRNSSFKVALNKFPHLVCIIVCICLCVLQKRVGIACKTEKMKAIGRDRGRDWLFGPRPSSLLKLILSIDP